MARSELGNFAQRLDTPSCVVICGVLGTVADELTLPTSTTNSLSSPSRTRWPQIGDAAISRHLGDLSPRRAIRKQPLQDAVLPRIECLDFGFV
jgi:hypothetical protein